MLEIGYGWDIVTLSEETERNREYKCQPVATTPVFYSTTEDVFDLFHFVPLSLILIIRSNDINPSANNKQQNK